MKKIVKDAVIKFLKYTKAHHILKLYFKGNGTILIFHRVLPTLDYHNRIPGNLGLEVSTEFLESIILYFK